MSDRGFAESIIVTFAVGWFPAYLVGGCVRDLLLGNDPKDFDVATDATPSQILELYPSAQQVGAHFGVIVVGKSKSRPFAAITHTRTAAALRRVHFETNPKQDAARRDFTINALFLDTDTNVIL